MTLSISRLVILPRVSYSVILSMWHASELHGEGQESKVF